MPRPDVAPEDGGKPFTQGLQALWAKSTEQRCFDVVIVGSGYGGAVAAAGLAGCTVDGRKVSVCVLERGKAYLPGDFPGQMSQWPAHARFMREGNGRVMGRDDGLFDFRLGEDVVALVANGLGGGSLINAGVMLRPDPASACDPMGPAVRNHVETLRAEGWYDKAERLLAAKPMADHACLGAPFALAKAKSLKTVADGSGRSIVEVPITVAMKDGANSANRELSACTLCGDCMTGCNVGAKDSLEANLLERARAEQAEIYTGSTVLRIHRDGPKEAKGSGFGAEGPDPAKTKDRWALSVVHSDPVLQGRETRSLEIWASRVILAAGTLGTTEILLRSRDHALVFSERLGTGFSANGDNLAAIVRCAERTGGAADESVPIDARRVGPTITTAMTLKSGSRVQEFSVPGPMGWLFDEAVTTTQTLHRLVEGDPCDHTDGAGPDPVAVDRAGMEKSLLVGVIGHDEGRGVVELIEPRPPRDRQPRQGAVRIVWPGARSGKRLQADRDELAGLLTNERLLDNPMWHLLPGQLADLVKQPVGPVLTVHPLGGCPIGLQGDRAVVDATDGSVFNYAPDPDDKWERTLAVVDGSVFGGSLGVNPALSITAHALRAVEALRKRWRFDESRPDPLEKRPRRRSTPAEPCGPMRPTEVEIIERLAGCVTLDLGQGVERRLIAQMTFAYEPRPIRELMQRGVTLRVARERSRLKFFDAVEWESEDLRVAPEEQRDQRVLCEAKLRGSLTAFLREPRTACERRREGALAWLYNRGWRDMHERVTKWFRGEGAGIGFRRYAGDLLKVASLAGEVRTLRYDLEAFDVRKLRDGAGIDALVAALEAAEEPLIHGFKRLTYNKRGNPWQQLMTLHVDRFPLASVTKAAPATFEVDARFFAMREVPLLRLVGQHNHANALRDLASFGLYLARMLVSIHLWTFRKPDEPEDDREPDREPGPIPGVAEPEVTELVVDRHPRTNEPVKIRLTRYRPDAAQGHDPSTDSTPVVMIHGYSVSGNTFTHPSLDPSAAQYFRDRGRDVWILDLRTSTALPTCADPWSIEEVALVDIPAALLHVRQVTGDQVHVVAHCIGCVMLGMAMLADVEGVRRGRVRLGVDTFLSHEQLGKLAAFNGAPPRPRPHPCIRSIVLSQKGPVLRYTDSNVLRAWVMQTLRRWLMNGRYDFRSPAKPTVSSELVDRLLASLPYPEDDWAVENPRLPCARTPWTATRHRMDVLYGRDFNAANLRPETLKAIDDLFGPIHLDTVAQTLHFARWNAATSQRGDAEFVTRDRLQECWQGIPTLAIHGAQNGLVDHSTQGLLKAMFPERTLTVIPVKEPPFDKLGHQDVLIGRTSDKVFEHIESFLRAHEKDAQGLQRNVETERLYVIDPAWLGPRLVPSAGAIEVIGRGRPDQGKGRLVLLPLLGASNANMKPNGGPGLPAPGLCAYHEWGRVRIHPADCKADVVGWVAFILYDLGQTAGPRPRMETGRSHLLTATLAPPLGLGGPEKAVPAGIQAAMLPAGEVKYYDSILRDLNIGFSPSLLSTAGYVLGRSVTDDIDWDAVHKALAIRGREGLAFLRRDRICRAFEPPEGPLPGKLRFALASCQYPSGLLDREIAERQLRGVATAADHNEIDLVLLAGDTIYADATAGLVDPVRRDERFEQPWIRALRAPAMQDLLARVPVQMLFDDHEFEDNWEPPSKEVVRLRREPATATADRRLSALRAWRTFGNGEQLDKPKDQEKEPDFESPYLKTTDRPFTRFGVPFFALDTRLGRSPRTARHPNGEICRPDQMGWLKLFLWQNRSRLKFVCTPSLLLPRRRGVVADAASASAADAWDGYPHSLEDLLGYIADNDIRDTVFLSGDEHHSMAAEIWVGRGGVARTKIVSIHCSALYAPFPFANGHPRELVMGQERFRLGGVDVWSKARTLSTRDGFAILEVDTDAASHITVDFRERTMKNGVASDDSLLRWPIALQDAPGFDRSDDTGT